MEDARKLLPVPPLSAASAPRSHTPPFVRTSLQKLRADTSRSSRPSTSEYSWGAGGLDGERASPPWHPARPSTSEYSWGAGGLDGERPSSRALSIDSNHTHGTKTGAGQSHAEAVAESLWQQSSGRERCVLNGFLTRDLERYRELFSEELRSRLRQVQETLEQANVVGLADKLLGKMDEMQVQGRENERLRGEYTELLRLNAHLRQQQIDVDASQLRWTAEKISAMVETLDGWTGVDMTAVERATIRAMEPLKQGQQGMQAKLKRVEMVTNDMFAEIRKMLRAELEPLRSGQQVMHTKLKRLEALHVDGARQRVQLKEEMERLLDLHVRKASAMDARLDQLCGTPAAVQAGAEGEPQAEAAAAASASAVAAASRSSVEVLDAIGELDRSMRDILGRQTEERAKLFANQGKMAMNQGEILQNLQAIHSSLSGLQGELGKVDTTVQDMPDTLVHRILSEESSDQSESMRLRQQLVVRNTEIVELRRQLDSGGSTILPYLGRIKQIERRGNLRMDLQSGEVVLDKEIKFKAKRQSDGVEAEFMNEGDALETLADLAELWTNFRVDMAIEGHSQGGENEFWQEIAANRASLVSAKLQEMGVSKEQIHVESSSGKQVNSGVAVEVKLDIFPECD